MASPVARSSGGTLLGHSDHSRKQSEESLELCGRVGDTLYMARTNRFPTTCRTCGEKVPAGAGRLVGKVAGKWVTDCARHGGVVTETVRPGGDTGEDAARDAVAEAGTRRRW